MSYYSALISQWNTLPSTDTTEEKLAAINAMSVPGPHTDVTLTSIVSYLGLNGKLASLLKYAANPPQTQSGVAAAELVAMFSLGSNAPVFNMANPDIYTGMSNMLTALTSDSNSGLTSTDYTNLLNLASTTIPWWQANGYTSPINTNDLIMAGGLI